MAHNIESDSDLSSNLSSFELSNESLNELSDELSDEDKFRRIPETPKKRRYSRYIITGQTTHRTKRTRHQGSTEGIADTDPEPVIAGNDDANAPDDATSSNSDSVDTNLTEDTTSCNSDTDSVDTNLTEDATSSISDTRNLSDWSSPSSCNLGGNSSDRFHSPSPSSADELPEESGAVISIMLFMLKHSLTNDALEDLLHLLECLVPNATFPTSVYKFKGLLNKITSLSRFTPSMHHFCDNCGISVQKEVGCTKTVCIGAKALTFHSLGVEEQLRQLFRDKEFCEMVFRESEQQSSNLTDITNGSEYKRMSEQSFVEGEKNITFTLNTDGVALFSSSSKGNLWPVYLAVNELPVNLRFSKKFLLTSHLFCQQEKPDMTTYLLPVMNMLKKMHTGLSVATALGQFHVRCHLLAVTVDLPARAMVTNMKQFNGKFGCLYCVDEGANPPNRPTLRYYPHDSAANPREHGAMLSDARLATATRESVRGVKGASPLAILPYVDLPKTVAIDWMHAVLLGVVKTLLGLWVDAANKGKPFYIGHKVAIVNERLLGIRTPDFIARQQRRIEDYKHWKASECREWLFHYSVPVISGIQSEQYTIHYGRLVTAMYLLNKECITNVDLQEAERCLEDFCQRFPDLYEPEKQTMNLHMLRHLVEAVRQHGPLFNVSCFGFESMNHHLKMMVHGTRFVNSQISKAVGMIKCLPDAVKCLMGQADPVMQSLLKRLGTTIMSSDRKHEEPKALGTVTSFETAFFPGDATNKCLRVVSGNAKYYSKEYTRGQRHSYTVMYKYDDALHHGNIKYFLIHEGEIYAVIERLDVQSLDNLCPHMRQLCTNQQHRTDLVSVRNIKVKCVFMDFSKCGNMKIISSPPNLLEHN